MTEAAPTSDRRPPKWPTLLALVLPLAVAFAWPWFARSGPAPAPMDGRSAYARCQACHGVAGQGIAGYAPALTTSPLLVAGRSEEIARRILHGGHPQAAWASTMPAFSMQFSDTEVAILVAWLQEHFGGQKGAPLSEDRIRALRQPGRP